MRPPDRRRYKTPHPTITVYANSIAVPVVSHLRVLGLILQSNRHNTHTIDKLSLSVQQTARMLARVRARRAGMREHDLLRLVDAFVAYLLCGTDVFFKYFEEVLLDQGLGRRAEAFASRLQRWQYRDENISLVEDWQSTDVVLRYFDPRVLYDGHQQQGPHATCAQDMGNSLVDNIRLASQGHMTDEQRWTSEQLEKTDWFVLMPGKDLALLPYALAFPWFDKGGTRFMNQAGLGTHLTRALSLLFFSSYAGSGHAGRAITRAIESANKATRPRDAVGPDRIAQLLRTLALAVSHDAYDASGAAEVDEHLVGFEAYGGTEMFFIASCYTLCRGSDSLAHFSGAECDESFRNIEGFGDAFGCELGSAMNPVNKTVIM
ncbi:hypothetical protein HPB50_026046 [Hyalomma asiaticum]|uniref:Uncharacterized protein n=1 Tax=Hyalomma asiaticum TaxID=266040 RepID=A0ACB7ST58_HYAAI|nr:hypothetical protein HPB50_026046 [Hyalomma asiaticum]